MNQRGFTLIELLISITMLAVIIGIMGGALSMAYQTMEKSERKINNLERKKIFFPLIESQIQSAFSSYYTDQAEKKSYFKGEKDMMVFASNYSIWWGTRGNCLVKYHIKTDDRGKSFLQIEERILGTDIKKETLLTTDHVSIRFEYFLNNSLEEGKWVDQWPVEEKNLPRKIRIHFADGMKAKVLTVNVFSRPTSSSALYSQPVVTK